MNNRIWTGGPPLPPSQLGKMVSHPWDCSSQALCLLPGTSACEASQTASFLLCATCFRAADVLGALVLRVWVLLEAVFH